ncbi:MAG: hypothetical protein JXA21_11270 [Anaerolineae bacterium]|nr:hypothetical protein [Anaerolineae bacterium]
MFKVDGLPPRQRARLEAALAREYNFGDDGVMPLRAYLERKRGEWTHKTRTVRRYGYHRVHLEYRELRHPRTEYSIWRGSQGIDVPKLVYDALDLPEVGDGR